MSRLICPELTKDIIGACMRVHNEIGNGFPEVIYQRALEIEFEKSGISFNRELEMEVKYRGEFVGCRRVDFLINDLVVVELKAVSALEPIHFSQIINYLKAYDKKIGLLINFGKPKLELKRFVR